MTKKKTNHEGIFIAWGQFIGAVLTILGILAAIIIYFSNRNNFLSDKIKEKDIIILELKDDNKRYNDNLDSLKNDNVRLAQAKSIADQMLLQNKINNADVVIPKLNEIRVNK